MHNTAQILYYWLVSTTSPWNFSDPVADFGMSDHFLVYAIRKICIPQSNPKSTVTRGYFKNFFPDSFRNDLSMVSWHRMIKQEHNPDIAWDIYAVHTYKKQDYFLRFKAKVKIRLYYFVSSKSVASDCSWITWNHCLCS